jgi:hypothetical protein
MKFATNSYIEALAELLQWDRALAFDRQSHRTFGDAERMADSFAQAQIRRARRVLAAS